MTDTVFKDITEENVLKVNEDYQCTDWKNLPKFIKFINRLQDKF